MDRATWADLAIFAAIVEAGSFTRAASKLGVSPSALSHTMRALEARLDTRLMHRTTRSLAPTIAGERLMARLGPAMADVSGALDALADDRERPAGRVRVTAHRTAALHVVLPRLGAFAKAYPDVAVELAIEDGLVDIVAARFDCGLRHEQMLDRDMVCLKVGEPLRVGFYAAPGYLADQGGPGTPHELAGHRCLCYRYTTSGALHQWRFDENGRTFGLDVPESFVSNDVDVVLGAALAGVGIACLSEPQAAPHVAVGALVPVLAAWMTSIPPNYLYYPSRRHVGAAFRAFVDAMKAPSGAVMALSPARKSFSPVDNEGDRLAGDATPP